MLSTRGEAAGRWTWALRERRELSLRGGHLATAEREHVASALTAAERKDKGTDGQLEKLRYRQRNLTDLLEREAAEVRWRRRKRPRDLLATHIVLSTAASVAQAAKRPLAEQVQQLCDGVESESHSIYVQQPGTSWQSPRFQRFLVFERWKREVLLVASLQRLDRASMANFFIWEQRFNLGLELLVYGFGISVHKA